MEYRWRKVSNSQKSLINKLEEELGIDPVLCQLLVQRDIQTYEEAKTFFRPSLDELFNPNLMKDMDKALERIEKAIKNEERILIYGDYDVDGTTAVSLLYSFLKNYYPNLDTYIPDRYKEGYGVSTQGIDYAHDNEMALIIALDCGIKAIEKVNYAAAKGIDFIICDHHRPGDEIPNAVAVLDPKRKDCDYPYKELSGCGVGFKLVQALCKKWELPNETWYPLLDLLAVSIGSDLVPITGENRILAFHGLQLINNNPRPAFKLLKELSGRQHKEMSITDVVFMLGPRINAAGRIAHGHLAVDLLTETDEDIVAELAQTVNSHNSERKELDITITQSALAMVEELGEQNSKSTVVYNESWHKGVIGIVASRLIETYYRPTIVFTESKGKLAGSARSVKGFDVYNALENCTDLLEQFGGHMYAAGMTLEKENYPAFKQKFEDTVARTILPEQEVPEIEIDATIKLTDITPKFYRILKQMAPFGPENMAPNFQTDGLLDTGYSKAVGEDGAHLRLVVREPDTGATITGIGFGLADKLGIVQSGQPFSVAYHIEENEFNGQVSLQMRVKDVQSLKKY